MCSRIDFETGGKTRLKGVEIHPLFEGEHEQTIRDVAQAALRRISSGLEVAA